MADSAGTHDLAGTQDGQFVQQGTVPVAARVLRRHELAGRQVEQGGADDRGRPAPRNGDAVPDVCSEPNPAGAMARRKAGSRASR